MCGQLTMSCAYSGVRPAYCAQSAGAVSARSAGSRAASAVTSPRVWSYCSVDIAGGTTFTGTADVGTAADVGSAVGVAVVAAGVDVRDGVEGAAVGVGESAKAMPAATATASRTTAHPPT